MKYFSMIGGIENEMIEKFITFYNDNQEEEVRIILNSNGGSTFQAETIIQMINLHKNISIIVQGAYSAAFDIIYSTKCNKILSRICRGMWHYGNTEIHISDNGKPSYYEGECILRNSKWVRNYTESLAKKIMTLKEYKLFLDNQDVYFDFKRMKEIFPKAEII